MSLIANQKFDFWKDVESLIRRMPLKLEGHQLSSDDSYRVANAYVLWALTIQELWEEDVRLRSDHALRSWILDVCKYDIVDVEEQLKRVLTCIRHWSPYMGVPGRDSFKRYLKQEGCLMAPTICRPFMNKLYSFGESYDGFRELNTALCFWSRLTLQDNTWDDDKAENKYRDFELCAHSWTYPKDLVAQMRELYLQWSLTFRPSDVIFRHGNGATYGCKRGAGQAAKYADMKFSLRQRQLLDRYYDQLPIARTCVSREHRDVRARIVFVPKGISKRRTISAEDTTNQYLQQGIFHAMDRWFQRSPWMHICLQRQEYNRELAVEASQYLQFGTIDLSDASDSVTHTLWKEITYGTPLYSLTERARTPQSELPSGEVIQMEKLSPMGSADTFPKESLVFSLACAVAERNTQRRHKYRVYGDDIIVHVDNFNETLKVLEALHFTINMDKTFAPGSVFAESCGVEAYLGEDVSPVRMPRFYDIVKPEVPSKSARVYGQIEFANRLGRHGLMMARAYLVRDILRVYPGMPFSSNERGFYSVQSTNFHLKSRVNADLQRREWRCQVLTTKEGRTRDWVRYQLCLKQMAQSKRTTLLWPEDRIAVSGGRVETRLVWRWLSQSDIDSIDIEKELESRTFQSLS